MIERTRLCPPYASIPPRRCVSPRKSLLNSLTIWSSNSGLHGNKSALARLTYSSMMLVFLLALLFLSGCGHPKQAKVKVPLPPPSAGAGQPADAQPSDEVNQEGTSSGNTKNNRSSGRNKGVADP